MPRALQIVLFLSVFLLLAGSIHYYFWARLIRDTALPHPSRTVATLAIVALATCVPASFLLGRAAPQAARVLAWPAYIWLGMMLLLLLCVAGADAIRAAITILHRLSEPAGLDPARRLVLQRALAGAATVAASGLGMFAVRNAVTRLVVREIEVPLARLPAALDGTTVVQLTDVHVGPTIGREFLEKVVAETNALRPDVIAITGDLVDGSVESLGDAVSVLGQLKARHGVYFVTGNHEYYAGVEPWMAELGRLGIRVLRNERVTIGEGDASFDLAGIDDHHARGMAPGHGSDLPRALAGRDPSRELVLLAHQPKAIHEAVEHGVGLQLSGHTHGGQIWPWGFMVRLQQPYVAGLVREGDTHLYVSSGTGYWGPPMRLATEAEITRITLRARPA